MATINISNGLIHSTGAYCLSAGSSDSYVMIHDNYVCVPTLCTGSTANFNNIVVSGDLTVHGSCTILNTTVCTTSAMSITNQGTGPALVVNQTGSQPVVSLLDDGNSVFYIEDGGNVGIGTTNPDSSLMVYKSAADSIIHVRGASNGADARVRINGYNSSELYIDRNGGGRFAFRRTTGTDDLSLLKLNDDYTDNSTIMFWDYSSGNVGIGTTNPTLGKLQVAGRGYFGPVGTGDATTKALMDTYSVLKLKPHDSNSTNMTFAQVNNGNGIGIQVTNGDQTADWDIALNPYGGNVGIGTSSPNSKLEVYLGDIFINGNNGHGIKIGSTNGIFRQDANELGFNTNSSERMRIDNAGNVGIGTASPSYKLDVYGSGFNESSLRLQRTDAGTHNDSAIVFAANSSANTGVALGGLWYQNAVDNNYNANIRARTDNSAGTSGRLEFVTGIAVNNSTVPNMVIKGSGNVGIGTTDPGEKLHVIGNITATCISVGGGNSGYLRDVTGSYGSIEVDGGATGGYEGYSIGGRAVFMHDNSNGTGIYNDVNDEWLFYGTHNAETRLYYNGIEKICTASTGACIAGNLYVNDVSIASGYNLIRCSHQSGHLEGSYNNIGANHDKTNPIYSIGSSYNPDENTLSNFYGIGYSNNTASFITGSLDAGSSAGWGLYVAADGDARIFLNASCGIISSTGQHYAANNLVWNAGNDGSGSGLDADLLDGANSSMSGGAGCIARYCTCNGYLYTCNWIYTGNTTGIFAGCNNAHFFPNTASNYGTWMINGNKDGWSGIYTCGGTFMVNSACTVMGLYNDVNNEWIFKGTFNGATELFYNGSSRLSTLVNGVKVSSSGEAVSLLGSTDGNRALFVIDGAANGDGSGGDYAYLAHNADGSFEIKNLQDNSINFATGSSGTTRMSITSGGSIGFGTDNPQRPVTLYKASTPVIQLVNSTTGTGAGDGFLLLQSGLNTTIENSEAGYMAFRTTANEKMRIDASGNVGIGTTSPGEKLEIQQNGNYQLKLTNGSTGGGNVRIAYADNTFGSGGSKVIFDLDNGGSANAEFVIQSDGNVGIGTTSPAAKLDVCGTDTVFSVNGTNGTLFSVVDDLSDSLMSVNDAAGLPVFEVFADNTIIGGRYNQNDFYLDGTSGNIGIGTTNPQAKLEVSDEALIDGLTVGRGGGSVSTNTAVGTSALENNTTGVNNTAVGYQSLYSNTTGVNNTANGYQSLYSTTTGFQNTASGAYSLYFNTTGNYNTANGFASLYSNTTGNYNTASGTYSLLTNTTGNNNTAHGYASLFCNTTGANNTAQGMCSLFSNTTGGQNVAIGYASLYCNTTGNNNTAHGYESLCSNTTGSNNVAIGCGVLQNNTIGSYNIAVGNLALYCNQTTCFNIAIGCCALFSNTTGSNNVAIGRAALRCNTSGYYNTSIGSETLVFSSTGNSNTTMGRASMYSNTTGSRNTVSGHYALGKNTTGSDNTATGNYALYCNTIGSFNIAIGSNTLYNNTTGIKNTAHGVYSLFCNTTGYNNTAHGMCSLYSNTTGGCNTASGYAALRCNTTGSYNAAHGAYSLCSNTNGSNNTAHGYSALCSNTTGESNTAVGYESLRNNTAGIRNTAVGIISLSNNTTGNYNTSSGSYSLRTNTTGSNNTAFGYQSLYSNTTGSNNTAFGYASLQFNTTGNCNTAVGRTSLYCNTTGINNTAHGYEALRSNTTGSCVAAFGYLALRCNTTGAWSAAFGACAATVTTGNGTTAIGGRALEKNTTGFYNTATGNYALFCNTTASMNSAFGWSALWVNTTGNYNVAVGNSALGANTTGGNNTGLGNGALINSTTGNDNVGIGGSAGIGNTTGCRNIFIGASSGSSVTTAIQTIAVGRAANPSNTDYHTVWGSSANNVCNCVYTSWSNVSDCRDKTDIAPLNSCYGISFIKKLSPVSYKWDNRQTYVEKCNYNYGQKDGSLKSEKCHYGFLAQDIKTSLEELNITFDGLGHDEEKDAYRLTYEELIAPLVKAVQELTERVEILEKDNASLKDRVYELENK